MPNSIELPLYPNADDEESDELSQDGSARVEEAPTWTKLLRFTLPFFGLQISWTIQQSFGVVYLAQLGFSDDQLPLLLAAGPIAGLVAPPIVGSLSDGWKSSLGGRKPFILGGGTVSLLTMLLLMTASPTTGHSGRDAGSTATAPGLRARMVASFAFYAWNFALQTLHIGLRTHVLDHFEADAQPLLGLWISRLSALGSVCVVSVAYAATPSFSQLLAISMGVLGISIGVAVLGTTHLPIRSDVRWKRKCHSMLSECVRRLWTSALTLPPVARRVCRVQLVAWMSWFIVLHYTGAYISRVYTTTGSIEDQGQTAVSRAAVIFHTGNLLTSLLIPYIGNMTRPGTLAQTERRLMKMWRTCFGLLTALELAAFLASNSGILLTVVLGTIGFVFGIANWIPYALMMQEIASLRTHADLADTRAGAAGLVSIHNIAICAPQVIAAGLVRLQFEVMGRLRIQPDVSWVFLSAMVPAIAAMFITMRWQH